MGDISLTASMRSNLLSLQNTQSLMDMTQERLSTGKKVNSAIDNPSSYYTARSLTNRANDLSALLDSMGQGIQTIKAANEGIETITSFVEQLKSLTNSALDTAKSEDIVNYSKQFNEVLNQIKDVANDSIYKGINLLKGDDLTVNFNEDRSSKLEVTGHKIYDELAISTVDETDPWSSNALTTAEETYATAKTTYSTAIADADTAYDTAAAQAKTTYEGAIKDKDPDDETDAAAIAAAKTTYDEALATAEETRTNAKATAEADLKTAETAYETAQETAIAAVRESLNATMLEVEAAINTLRSVASEFGNNFSIIQNREEFTENIINVLEEGSDNLTLADMNEESANMLALQTRQQLGINSLSLASQASQAVLKLF